MGLGRPVLSEHLQEGVGLVGLVGGGLVPLLPAAGLVALVGEALLRLLLGVGSEALGPAARWGLQELGGGLEGFLPRLLRRLEPLLERHLQRLLLPISRK